MLERCVGVDFFLKDILEIEKGEGGDEGWLDVSGVKKLFFFFLKGIRERKRGLYVNGKKLIILIKCYVFFIYLNFRKSGEGSEVYFY